MTSRSPLSPFATASSTSPISSAPASLSDLLSRITTLLSELTQLTTHLASLRHIPPAEFRPFRSALLAERASLSRLCFSSSDGENGTSITERPRHRHALASSNVPFLEAVWTVAKRCKGVVALSKRFAACGPEKTPEEWASRSVAIRQRRSGALVDVVAEEGLVWVKVSTVSEARLLFELAKQGWEHDNDSDSDSDSESGSGSRSSSPDGGGGGGIAHKATHDDDDMNADNAVAVAAANAATMPLMRTAADLVRAARATRVRYRHPHVHFALLHIARGRVPAIDTLLARLARTGVLVHAGADANVSAASRSPESMCAALAFMPPAPLARLTSTLNVDCTLLLALISDLSHARVVVVDHDEDVTADSPWQHAATGRQRAAEHAEHLLEHVLYPVLAGRALTCTAPAAQRCHEIVQTIGTASERARAALLFGGDAGGDAACDGGGAGLRAGMAALSEYAVPEDWMLPVEVVGEEEAELAGDALPRLAEGVRGALSRINESVFFYGWRSGRTTVTSNKAVCRIIETAVERCRGIDEEDVVGPDVWVCHTARSLVGKEKSRV